MLKSWKKIIKFIFWDKIKIFLRYNFKYVIYIKINIIIYFPIPYHARDILLPNHLYNYDSQYESVLKWIVPFTYVLFHIIRWDIYLLSPREVLYALIYQKNDRPLI